MGESQPRKLGDVATIVMGQSPTGDTCNREGIGIPLLNGPTEFGPSHPTATQFTTDARKLSQASDLLFCVRGSTTGRMNWSDQEYAIGRGIAAIRHKFNPGLQPLIRAAIENELPSLLQSATGSTFPNVSASQLATIRFPRLEPQKEVAIAVVLSALDDKIELNRRMNATLEAQARALFKDWFVDYGPTRAKMAKTTPYLAPEIWSLFPDRLDDKGIPEGWEEVKAGKILKRLKCHKRFKKEDVQTNGAIPIFEQGADILLGYHSGEAEFLASPEKPLFIFGDHTCVTKLSCRPFSISQNVIPLEGEKHPSIWTFYAVRQLQSFQEYKRHWSDLIEKLVTEPSAELSKAFSETVSQIVLKKEANELESRTLAQTRDLLLPKLMSGEIRVGEAQKPVEGAR